VSPVKYELGFCIPEDGILRSHCRENLKSYMTLGLHSNDSSNGCSQSIASLHTRHFRHDCRRQRLAASNLHSDVQKGETLVLQWPGFELLSPGSLILSWGLRHNVPYEFKRQEAKLDLLAYMNIFTVI
jgi:hypothetical protein